jgi:flagellar hook-length control protein FliK
MSGNGDPIATRPASATTPPAPTAPTAAAANPDAALAAVTGAAPVGPTAPTAAAPASEAAPVTRQVFPEVVRVAQTGGTQRVTVRLQPEALGEVRVVLTTHRGQLRVSLAADGDAHRALVEGTPELRRLLEAVGGTDARIVVRDLPGSTQTGTQTGNPTPARQDGLGDPSGSSAGGTGSGPPGEDRSAPTNGRTTATDGTPDATSPSRRTESVTGGRTVGLDVTM